MKKYVISFLLISSTACASVGSITHEPASSLLCDNTVYYQIFIGDSITDDSVNSGDQCAYLEFLQNFEGLGCWGHLGSKSGCTKEGYDPNHLSQNGWATADMKTAFSAEVSGILPVGGDEANFWIIEYGGANDWAGCTPDFNTICSDADMNLIADRKIDIVEIGIAEYPNAKGMSIYPTAYGTASNGSMKSVEAFGALMDAKIDEAQAGGLDIIGCDLHEYFKANGCGTGYTWCFDDNVHLSDAGEALAGEGIFECKTNCANVAHCNN